MLVFRNPSRDYESRPNLLIFSPQRKTPLFSKKFLNTLQVVCIVANAPYGMWVVLAGPSRLVWSDEDRQINTVAPAGWSGGASG